MAKIAFLPGFRFHPTDVELVCFYLKRKICGRQIQPDVISELDIYKFDPWDLPGKSCLHSRDLQWYFYCSRDRKHANGSRTNRATEIGYWKTTGKDRPICNNSRVVGMKKTLVFHIGRAPYGDRTNWVMHEYRLEDKNMAGSKVSQDAFVLCRIFEKSGPGPRNGEQYGAPFKEEEWSEEFVENLTELQSSNNYNIPSTEVVENPTSSSMTEANFSLQCAPGHGSSFASGEQSASQENPSTEYDDIDKMLLELAAEGEHLIVSDNRDSQSSSKENNNDGDEILNNPLGSALGKTHLDASDIYVGLEDITNQVNLGNIRAIDIFDFLSGLKDESELLHRFDPLIAEDSFIELKDLQYPMDVDSSMLINSSDPSCAFDIPQASVISSANMNSAIMPAQAQNMFCSVSNSNYLFKDQVAEAGCAATHPEGHQVVIQDPSASPYHVVAEKGSTPTRTTTAGEGHDNGDGVNNPSNGGGSLSKLESLLDYFPARPASAAEYPLLPKEGKIKGNVSSHSFINASTATINHMGVEGSSVCIRCCDMAKGKQPAKCLRKVGTGMSWTGVLIVFLLSSVSVIMWILLLVLGFKFFRCVWKLILAWWRVLISIPFRRFYVR